MRHMRSSIPLFALMIVVALFVAAMLAAPPQAGAQATISTGSVQGTIVDPKGAVVTSARITITNKDTGQKLESEATSAGTYNSGPLPPGRYVVRVAAQGFKTVEQTVEVAVGIITSANITLELGSENTVVTVESSAISVNTEQATVQGILDAEQIENLPVNGRNFLDLAQLEPGVQIQDAANFAVGKDGYSAISFAGRFGRTARIEVDGIDISDEIFGSATANIPASGIQEFQLSQSSLDLSTELTTSGAVNVTTRSGTNAVHGETFSFFRDSSLAAALPAPPGLSAPFQRSQYGGRLGGPIIKNKFFYFVDGERTLQHEQAPVLVAAPFQQFSGSFKSPFHDNDLMARTDYQLARSIRLFYRLGYFQNSFTANGGSGFSVYAGKNVTRTHVAGLDCNTGSFSHSIRF